MPKTYTAEHVYRMLTKQRFTDWYENDFVDHISSENNCKDAPAIVTDLETLLDREVY